MPNEFRDKAKDAGRKILGGFADAFAEVKIINGIKENLGQLPLQKFHDIITKGQDLPQLLISMLPDGKENRRQMAAQAYNVLQSFGDEKVLSLFEEAAPRHGKLLRENHDWYLRQMAIAKNLLKAASGV